MSKFLAKYYPPWSFLWVLQRILLKIRDFNFQSFSWEVLWTDFKLHKKTKTDLRNISQRQSIQDDAGSLQTGSHENETGQPYLTLSEAPVKDLSMINSYFDHVYVVNLKKRKDRHEKMIKALNALRIKAEIFQAVDGYHPENLKEFEKYYNSPVDPDRAHELEIKLKRKVIYSPGAWGTLKTYYKLLKDAKEKKYKRILSLEDDVLFATNFEILFKNAVGSFPESWKLLYLGASQHSWESGVDLNYPGHINFHDGPGYYHPVNTDGAFAIGIDSSVFDLLIHEIEKMNCSFDSGALRHVCRNHSFECYVLQPNIVIADVTESDNSIGREMVDFAKIARWDLSLFDYPGNT